MKLNVFSSDSIIGRVFQEAEATKNAGLVVKNVDLTTEEYNQLLEETGQEALTNLFGLELLIDGVPVPSPFDLMIAQAQDAARKSAGEPSN